MAHHATPVGSMAASPAAPGARAHGHATPNGQAAPDPRTNSPASAEAAAPRGPLRPVAPPAEHPYAPFVHEVQKPSQYLGGEHGEKIKDWTAVDARVCLAFPDLYEIGMSHLGFKILYGLLNAHPRLLAERAYAPWPDMEAKLRQYGQPLRSLETWHALREFDVVGFSLQFELTYTNVLLMLDLGGIPLRAEERGEDDPLVVAGGPTATHAEPMAAFFDCMLIGDGEKQTPALALRWAELKRAGRPRAERLRELARLTGVYVPALYATRVEAQTGLEVVDRALVPEAPLPVRRAFVADLSEYPFPVDGPVAATETVFDRVSVEIARGCTEGCRFCQAGMIYRPVRERRPEDVIAAIERAVQSGGYDEASLTCLSTADYSAIHPLVKEVMRRLEGKKVSLAVSSLRAYGLDEDLLDAIQKVRATGLTFAPEAGTQRMRDVVNKNVTEEQLMTTAERVFSRGWSKMKLYFMIGLPTEEDDDVRGIVQTGVRALAVGRRVQKGAPGRGGPRVTVSVSTHVPKPHTPFQWCAMDTHAEIVRKQELLRAEARGTGIDLRMHDARGSWLEGLLARGDRRLAGAVERAYRAGARFDSWEEQLRLDAWQRALAEEGIVVDRYLGTIPVDARLPWDHIDVGLEEGFLAREYRKALQNRLSPPCGKVAGAFVHPTNVQDADAERRRLVCYDCGVACDLTRMREERREFLVSLGALVRPPPRPAAAPVTAPRERRPRARFQQGEAARLRLGYTKLGRAAFASHLDLVRLLPRMLRRLDLPLYYSEGFHPRPELVFGPALSLGIASLGEYVDVKVCADVPVDVETLAQRLDAVASEGIRVLGARRLGPNDASVNKVIDEAVYVAGLSRDVLAELGLPTTGPEAVEALAARIAARRAEGRLVVRRVIDGLGKDVDVGAFLLDARAGAGAEVLTRAGVVGELVPLELRLRITGGGAAKAQEALDVLLAPTSLRAQTASTTSVIRQGVVRARLVREGLYATRDGVRHTPLDLEALRRVPARPTATAADATVTRTAAAHAASAVVDPAPSE